MFRPIVFAVGFAFSPAVTSFAADIEEVEKLFERAGMTRLPVWLARKSKRGHGTSAMAN